MKSDHKPHIAKRAALLALTMEAHGALLRNASDAPARLDNLVNHALAIRNGILEQRHIAEEQGQHSHLTI